MVSALRRGDRALRRGDRQLGGWGGGGANLSSRSSERPAITTVAPLISSTRATWNPIPLLPPVTSAT